MLNKRSSSKKSNFIECVLLIVLLNTSINLETNENCQIKRLFDCRIKIELNFTPLGIKKEVIQT